MVKVSKISKLRIIKDLKDKVHLSMLFRHLVLLFYECIIAALFVYLTFDDPYDIWLTNAHVFMTLIQTNVSRQRTNISNIPVSRD